MKKLTTILGAATLLLPAIGLFAQESDAVVSQSGNSGNGFFACADYFQYTGAGAPGRLVAIESNLNFALIQYDLVTGVDPAQIESIETPYPKTPKGDVTGGTIGYTWKNNHNDRFYIQAGYRSGTIDTNIIPGWDINFGNNTHAYVKETYKQDTDEYRIQFSYSPHSFNYLTLGLEYAYSKYDAIISTPASFDKTTWFPYFDTPWGATDTVTWNDYGFKQKTHDILAHATLKSPVIPLVKTSNGGLFLMPRVDIGVGYSIRSADLVNGGLFSTAHAEDILSTDKWVIETTATLGLCYQIQTNHALSLDVGYRYKSDLGSDTYGTDQKGVYGRLGYTYSW